ncbi:uncharacterized protein LOC106054618 isoform X1 [Biomphalaria glabrata]|uniref:Uncharacterized protein LOC106054618 isoform X1 n=2 Tax=Biomphalaria glabrata TaxID=6526 RepID=A0A9W2ZF68_BIOGL|nr:uncharacterized protein LOC106054618 isoform X1 [Biomphalaria glabrata]
MAQTLGAIVIREKNSCAMPNLAEVNLTLKYYKENHSCDITVPVGITVSEFKESCTFAPQKEIKDCHVAFKSENDKLFLIKDTEVISSCIAQAKEILLLSMGEQHPQQKTDSESHRSTDQFAWFDNLADEIKNKRLTPGIASLLAPCFGQFWESVFYCLGFTTEIVDLEMENCKHNAWRAATKLLMKWEHKVTKDATLKSLMERMIRVHKYGCTVINWKSVQEIMTNHV